MKCDLCENTATIQCTHCLDMDDHPDDVIKKKSMEDKGTKPNFHIRLVPAYRWTPTSHTYTLCNKCSTELWLACAGAVNAGYMNWLNKPI